MLTTCAVLVGLAFMHSLGAAIGTGCPAGTSSMATSVAPSTATGGHAAVTVEATTTMSDPALLTATVRSSGHGAVCVSTPPRSAATGLAAPAAAGPAQPATLDQPSVGIPQVGGALPVPGRPC